MRKIFLYCLFFFLYSSLCSAADFKIVELMPNTQDDKNLEYITVKNISDTSRSLSWFTLSDLAGKKYIFWDEILEPEERRDFFRTQTKIILNNSDERVFLYDAQNNVVDEVYFESSDKWYFLSFPEEEWEGEDEYIISEEWLISGELFVSDEVSPEDSEDEESELDSDNWENEEWTSVWNNAQEEITSEISAPEVSISFQRPSYISQSGSTNIFICDSEREECKINFDFRESFSENFPENEYECQIDFGVWRITGEENKCNPNTVIIPQWESTVRIKISHEDESDVYSEKIIHIHNYKVVEVEVDVDEESQQVEEQENQEEIADSSSENNDETQLPDNIIPSLFAPEIILSFQRPSYISELGSTDIFMCDNSKDACKVNFDMWESFWESMPEGDYICRIDFWFFSSESEKCNPNTVSFPPWIYEVSFQIIHKNNQNIFSEKRITIHHIENVIKKEYLEQKNISEYDREPDILSILKPEIVVQSGLEWERKYFECKKNPCKINLNYIKKHKNEQCYWNFKGGSYENINTRKRCNPWYVTFPEWIFELSLRVYEKNNEENYKITRFYIYNEVTEGQAWNENILVKKVYEEEWDDDEKDTNKQGRDDEHTTDTQQQEVLIELQGKISKEKILWENMLTCQWVEKCYVNLISLWTSKKASFVWLLGGVAFSDAQNPKGIWIEWEWNHTIELRYTPENQEIILKFFEVTITPEIFEEIADMQQDDASSVSKTKISKIFSQNFLVLKYDGLRISWKAPIWSKIEIYIWEDNIGEAHADEKWKYRFVTKNLSAGEYIFSTKIIQASWEELFLPEFKSYRLTQESRSFWFAGKKSSSRKKSALSKTPKIPELIIQSFANDEAVKQEEDLSFGKRMLIIFIIVFSSIFGWLHMIFLQTKIITKTLHLDIFTLTYNTKQKVLLTL